MTGGIGGLFGGPTKLDIKVDLGAHTGAKNQPKWMKSKPGVTAEFSMIATEADGQFDVEFGIVVDITANVHHTELLFDAKVALEFEDEKIDVKIVADLKDKKGWHKPFGIPGFGIPGFTLYEVGLDLGIDENGAIHLGFDGNIKVSGDTFKIAADADLLPEALGAPQDIAFVGSADKVDRFFMEAIAIEMIGSHFNLEIPSGILPTFTKVKFAFVTPGAADPDLHITGQGFALAGAMNWLNHELGKMNVAVSPTKGITASGKIDNMSLGPLVLRNNDFSIKAAPTGIPSLKVDSDIVLLGVAKERFHIEFDKTGVNMAAHFGAGSAADITAKLRLSGINLGAKKPDFKKADFFIEGDVQLNVQKFIAGPAQAALNDVFNGLTAAFAEGKKAVTAAETKVNGLQGRLNGQWASYHYCHGWHKWPCRIREGIRIGWTEGELRVADAALNFVRSLISHFPIDLDPRVAGLILARDTARETLHLAEKAIEGLDKLDDFMKKATAKLTEALSNVADINIKKASFKGDVQGIIKHDEPVDLAIDIVLFGAEIKDQFAFKIKSIGQDLAGDVEQLALLGLYALEHLIERGVGGIPGPLKNKLKGAVATKMDAKGAAHKRELAKYAKEFSNYNKTATAIQAANAAYNTAFLKAELERQGASPLDSDKSETFGSEMIEVGHTGLCLTNVGGVVKQYSCMSHADQKWSTRPAAGAPGVKASSGYVFLYQPGGGHCIAPEGTWRTVEQKFGDFTFQEQEFFGDGTISLMACFDAREYYWKILQHGDGWMQIANLGTNKCLHFTNSSSSPGVAEAEWKPCTGAANQVYRIANSASPKIYKANISLKNDAQSTCFSNPGPGPDFKVFTVNCGGRANYDYGIDIRGYIRFINVHTGKCLQPEGYAVRGALVERTCSQLDYQWWNPIAVPGGWRIQNAQTKECTFAAKVGAPAQMLTCNDSSNMVIAPVTDPNSGVTFVAKSPGAAPAHPKPVYAGTPANMGICAMNGMVNASWVTGSLGDNGQCWVNVSGTTHVNTGTQKYLYAFDGTEWVAGGKGTVPTYAIPTGFTDTPSKGIKTAYTCRTKFIGNFTGNVETTRFGWTTDGATCIYTYYDHKPTNTFEILARQPAKSYPLRLDDFWRVPKKGAWYPGLPHVLAKKSIHKIEHSAEKAVRKLIPKIHIRHHHWRL